MIDTTNLAEQSSKLLQCSHDIFGKSARDLASVVFDRSVLSDIRDRLKDDSDFRSNVLSSSYHHDNGFAKIVIFDWPAFDVEYRLHVWDDNETKSSNIHNHTRAFVSHILAGVLIVSEHEPVPGDEFLHYRCSSSADGTYNVGMQGRTGMKTLSERALRPGDTYACRESTLHSVESAKNSLTATLFVQGRRTTDITDVYSRESVDDSSQVERFSIDSIVEIIKKVELS